MSEFACPVVRIGTVTKHDNADTLSITEVDGQPVIFKNGDFKEGDLATYIPIESVVKQDSAGGKLMPWLKYNAHGLARIKAAKLRGVFSMGVLVAAPAYIEANDDNPSLGGWNAIEVGYDVAPHLGIKKYEEPEHGVSFRGPDENAPTGFAMPTYDVEPFRKFKRLFQDEEYVVATEKLHGCNARFAFFDGKLWVGSHNRWKKRPETEQELAANNNVWWRAALQQVGDTILISPPGHPETQEPATSLEEKLQHPDVAQKLGFYGEVYGQVQDLKYGVSGVRVAMFDIRNLVTGEFLDYPDFLAVCAALKLETTPTLYTGQFKGLDAFKLAEGPTEAGGGVHMREGLVVRTLLERRDPRYGRMNFKLVGQEYLLRKGGTEAH